MRVALTAPRGRGLGRPLGHGMGDLDPNAILPPSRDILSQQTDLLLSNIKQLAQDWFNTPDNSVTQTQLSSWDAFVAEVNSWDYWPRAISHLVDTTWRDELIGYQTQFNQFLSQWQEAGVPTSVPAFTFTPAAPSTLDKLGTAASNAANNALAPVKKGLQTIEYVGIGLGVAAVAFIFYLTYEGGKTARHIGAEFLKA